MTARERFQQTPEGKAFLDMSRSPVLLAALDATLLDLVEAGLPGDDAAKYNLIAGAKNFRARLLRIAEPPKKAKMPSDNLNDV